VTNRVALRAALTQRLGAAPSAEWLARLSEADIPCGPINDLAAAFADPQVAARRMIETAPHPTIGEVRMTGIPFKLSETPAVVRAAPPLLGQHSDEILAWLGYAAEEIARLRTGGVI